MINENSFSPIFNDVIDFLRKSGLDKKFVSRLCSDLENSKGLIFRKYDGVRNHTKSTYNPFWAVRDMFEICRQNGGLR